MDAAEFTREGYYGVLGGAGARTEMPGCSLCMGMQAQVREGATVVSTFTRNFFNIRSDTGSGWVFLRLLRCARCC